jgi:hypothetical protein
MRFVFTQVLRPRALLEELKQDLGVRLPQQVGPNAAEVVMRAAHAIIEMAGVFKRRKDKLDASFLELFGRVDKRPSSSRVQTSWLGCSADWRI